MDWYEKQINQSLKHASDHRNNIEPRLKDLSCRVCYPINEESINGDFNKFWEWYQGITSAETFSANAESVFKELMKKNTENILEGRENFRINALIYSIRYRNNSGFTIKDIRARIINMIIISEKFTRDMDEAAKSYKTNSSEEDSPKEESSNEQMNREFENRRIQIELEKLRKLRELEIDENIEKKIEEVITPENPYSAYISPKIETFNEKRIRKDSDIESLELNEREVIEMDTDGTIRRIEKNLDNDDLIRRLKEMSEKQEQEEKNNRNNEEEERYNMKKEKYDKIKKKIGDEIDKELIKGRERLHKSITQRIKYFEEKEELTIRETKELEDLKKSENLEKEELSVEEYIIDEIYTELFENEKNEDKMEDTIHIEKKNKEKRNSFELNEDEEYTVDMARETHKNLGKFFEEMEKEIDKEKEEINFPEKNEKVINTPEISSSLNSSEESSSNSSEEFEIIKPKFNYYLDDLNFELLFGKHIIEVTEMALSYGVKFRTFEGKINENVDEWIEEFETVAEFNDWIDDNDINSPRFKAARAHLRGDAMDFYRRKRLGNDDLRWDDGAAINSGNKFKEELRKEFSSSERKQHWQLEFFEVRQQLGESVESYAQRFRQAAKKVGTDIAEAGKAGIFTKGLLPAIYSTAILGSQRSLSKAIESAKRGELSAMGYARQIIPEQVFNNNSNNRIFQDMTKEKNKDAIEDLMNKFEKLEVKLMNQLGNSNNRRNFQGNNQRNNNIVCFNCNRIGHISPNCPERMNENRNYRGDNRNNNRNRNYNQEFNRRNNNRNENERSLNFLHTANEERIISDYESSDEEEYSINQIEIEASDNEDNEYQVFAGPIRNTRSATKRLIELENEKRPQSESKREKKLQFKPDNMETDEEDFTEHQNNLQNYQNKESSYRNNFQKKMTRTEALQKAHQIREKKFKCRNCDTVGHFTVNCPTLSPKEKEKALKAKEKNREKKEKIFPIDLEEHIRNLPCGINVEQAFEMIPGYKRKFNKVFKVVKKGKKVNFMEIPKKSKFTSMRSKAEIEDVKVDAVIDTGAAISAMTRTLIEELGYKIDKPSNVVIVTADGKKTRSLGKIVDIELILNGVDTIVTVEVIESKDRTLILGNDWLRRVQAQIDMEKGKINVKGKKGFVDIPVEFYTKKNKLDEESEEEYEDEELEETEL